jgi:hypothetical protein
MADCSAGLSLSKSQTERSRRSHHCVKTAKSAKKSTGPAVLLFFGPFDTFGTAWMTEDWASLVQ